MQRASLVGAVLVALFGVPFFLFGSIFALKMFQSTDSNPGTYAGVAFGSLFALIGLGLMVGAVAGYRALKRQQAVAAANPQSPWLWREDWANGCSKGKGIASNITLWVFATFWDVISFTIAAMILPKLWAQGDLKILLVLIFPLAGVILTIAAIVGTLRAQRYGRTSFWFSTTPFVPGEKLSGSIHLKMQSTAPHGIDVRLSCVRRVTSGSGKNRSTVDTVLWQNERNIPGESIMRADFDVQIPVEFSIPVDAPSTNSNDVNDKIVWILHARADVPGVDFKDDYELPVFQTSTRAMAAGASSEAAFTNQALNPHVSADWQPQSSAGMSAEPVVTPTNTRIRISEDGASITVYLPPLRNPGQTLGLFAFACVWTGVVYLLFTHPAPWFFRIIFGGANLLILYGLISMIVGSTTLRVAEGSLSIRKAMFGIGRTKYIPKDGVQSVAPVSQGQADASGAARFGVFIQLTDNRTFRIAANSLTRTEARWMVAALDRALGKKQDAEPQFKPLAMPLPMNAKPGIVRIGGVEVSKIGRWIGLLFVAGWLFFFLRFFVKVFVR